MMLESVRDGLCVRYSGLCSSVIHKEVYHMTPTAIEPFVK